MMCCYYPTSIIAIDDDKDFLSTIRQHLELTNCVLFTSPREAINNLINQRAFTRMQSRLLKTTTSMLEEARVAPEHYALLINLRGLHEEIYSSDRFRDVSVLIVDYHMEEINGIDLCEQLSHHPAKKILLTGGIDREKVAIEAFNKGIIHRFINKSDINFPTQLKQTINILKEAYFRDLSQTLIPHLPEKSTQLLQNAAYINFIRGLQTQKNVDEYYLLDTSGSIILLRSDGAATWIIIKNDIELDDFILIANEQDGSEDLIQAIKKRQKIPFFFSEGDYQQPVNNWDKYLYQCQPLPGISGYYYSIVEGHIRDNLHRANIVSYLTYSGLTSS